MSKSQNFALDKTLLSWLNEFSSLILLFFSHQILEKVKIAYDIPIVTDVHEASQVKVILLFQNIRLLVSHFVCLFCRIHIPQHCFACQDSHTVVFLAYQSDQFYLNYICCLKGQQCVFVDFKGRKLDKVFFKSCLDKWNCYIDKVKLNN